MQSLAVLAYGHGISAKWLVICKVSDQKLNTFHFSRPLHSLFKELLTKRQPPKELLRRGKGYERIGSETERAKINETGIGNDVVYKRSIQQLEDGTQKTNLASLLPHVLRYGKLLQLKSPGFLSNRRQHRQCGYAILEMAQTIRREWRQESLQYAPVRCLPRMN